jgi:hypothetical protein
MTKNRGEDFLTSRSYLMDRKKPVIMGIPIAERTNFHIADAEKRRELLDIVPF